VRRLWERVFFAPAHPLCLSATRVILCAQALWILLSRPDLPDLLRWPREFFVLVDPRLPLRFGLGLPAAAEWALFVILHAALLAALLGLRPAVTSFLSALLLYHFAPFEEIVAGLPHTAFGGLTVPTVGLFILAFARTPGARGAPSWEYRWPFALIQLLFALSYLFPTLAKLHFSGPGWYTADNIHYYLLGNHSVTLAPLARALAARPALCAAVAGGTLALEALSPLVVVSSRFALAFVPAALAFHLGIVFAIGYFFPSLPLLLLLLPWDAVGRRFAAGVESRQGPEADAA
jgi:hypothetical protein